MSFSLNQHSGFSYHHPRILGIFFLGFSSGLPFLLTLATLHVWLSEVHISKTVIGVFSLVTLPYTLKFLWAPFVDSVSLPFLTRTFGRRKSWMLLSQVFLALSLLLLGGTRPQDHIGLTATFGFAVAFFSALQDISCEAYRAEALGKQHLGMGAGASMLGYRLGMWVSGAGALYLASYFSWFVVYSFMAACISIGFVTTLLSSENMDHEEDLTEALPPPSHTRGPLMQGSKKPFKDRLRVAIESFRRFNNWKILIAYIIFYKVGDTILNVMTSPFLLEMGFSKLEIAHVAKSFGIGAVILGGFLGSFMLSRKPLVETLFLCAILQIVSCFLFALQAYMGHNINMLFLTLGVENLTCGLGTAAFIMYLSQLCQRPFTATHYAFLSSIGSFARVSFSPLAGWAADHVSWINFYLLAACACVPSLILVLLCWSHFFQSHRFFSEGEIPQKIPS